MNILIVKTRNEAKCLFSLLLFIITLEVLISGTEEEETRVTYIWEVKLSTHWWHDFLHRKFHTHMITQLCLTLCNSMNHSPTRLLCPWDFPSKSTGKGSHFLLQGIFLTKGLNLCPLHCRRIPYLWATWKVLKESIKKLLDLTCLLR